MALNGGIEMNNDVIDQEQQQNTNGASGNGQRTFTQDDVNRIVQERLAKEKQKSQEDIAEKQKALEAKELRLDSIALLRDKGLPDELADIIKADNIKEFGENADKLKNIINNTHESSGQSLIGNIDIPGKVNNSMNYIDNEMRNAFGL